MRVLLIGGTGAFSSRIAEVAVGAGHQLMLCTRGCRPLPEMPPGPRQVRWLQAERAALRDHAEALSAFDAEAVIDSICFSPERAEDLVALFPRARRVVLISSVDVYGEEIGAMPVDETRPPQPATDYARGKLAAERVVFAGLGARATVFRPSHILGRGFLTTSLWGRSPHWVDRIRRGKPVPLIDGGRNLMTPVWAGDAAVWVVAALASPAADGEIFNAAGAETVSQRHYQECIAERLGTVLRPLAVPSAVASRHLAAATALHWHRVYSPAKAIARLGHRPLATLRTMVDETVDHMLAHDLVRPAEDHPVDDELVALLERQGEDLGRLLDAAVRDGRV